VTERSWTHGTLNSLDHEQLCCSTGIAMGSGAVVTCEAPTRFSHGRWRGDTLALAKRPPLTHSYSTHKKDPRAATHMGVRKVIKDDHTIGWAQPPCLY
jgi:hypothetical protein